jgi:hypothetical protein
MKNLILATIILSFGCGEDDRPDPMDRLNQDIRHFVLPSGDLSGKSCWTESDSVKMCLVVVNERLAMVVRCQSEKPCMATAVIDLANAPPALEAIPPVKVSLAPPTPDAGPLLTPEEPPADAGTEDAGPLRRD